MSRCLFWATLVALFSLCPGSGRAAGAAGSTLSAVQRLALDRGEVLTRTRRVTKTVGRGEALGVIDAAPRAVFAVVADVARYREFMHRLVKSRVVKRMGAAYHFAYTIDMPWPLSDHHCVTHNVHLIDEKRGHYERRWRLVSGTFHKNAGYWRVRPWAGGKKTLVYYSVEVQPKTAVPDFVVNFVAKKALPRAIKSLRKRMATLAGRRGKR